MLGAKNRALYSIQSVPELQHSWFFRELPPFVTIVWISKTMQFLARRHVLGGSGLGSFYQKEAKVILRRCLNLLGVASSML
jgi:hypothetical protein